jgi:molybdopterin-binding protein
MLELCPYQPETRSKAKLWRFKLGNIMAHVVVQIGPNQIESVITRRSAEELGLKDGDKVRVVIKSTEVIECSGVRATTAPGAHVSISIWTGPDNSQECRVQRRRNP